jgi:OOP family OmpA-OmpF porin
MLRNKALWWTLLVAWILGSSYWHVCRIRGLCDTPFFSFNRDDISHPVIVPDIAPPLIISDPPLLFQAAGNFAFKKSEAIANFNTVAPAMDSLAHHLLANPGKHLIITGVYGTTENNNTTYLDLGMARAAEVKKVIVAAGVYDSLITLKGELNDGVSYPSDSLHGGISFTFENRESVPLTEADFARSEHFENIFKPMDLYFPTASIFYIKTRENQQFIDQAKAYILANPGKVLHLTGHTDDEDSETWNLKLSKKRALAVKAQLIKAGFPPNSMTVEGKGESQPKASNATIQGRIANRRVTIVVK